MLAKKGLISLNSRWHLSHTKVISHVRRILRRPMLFTSCYLLAFAANPALATCDFSKMACIKEIRDMNFGRLVTPDRGESTWVNFSPTNDELITRISPFYIGDRNSGSSPAMAPQKAQITVQGPPGKCFTLSVDSVSGDTNFFTVTSPPPDNNHVFKLDTTGQRIIKLQGGVLLKNGQTGRKEASFKAVVSIAPCD